MPFLIDEVLKPPVVNPAANEYAGALLYGASYNIPNFAEYKRKIAPEDLSVDDPNMYAKAAANTPILETVGIGLKNLAVSSIGMFAQNASTLPDLFNGNIAKMAIGDADVWGETIKSGGLYGWGSNFMRDNMQIALERDPNTVNPADPAWWANVIAPGVGSVIGIVGESAVEARAAALIGAGIGTVITPGFGTAVGGAIGTGIGMVEKIGKMLQGLTTAKNAKKVFMGTYAIGRGREAIMNAAATYEETLQTLRDKGIPEEQANKQASEAASYMFRRDFVTGTALGAVEAALMTYSPIKGGLVEGASKWNVLERGLDLIPNKIAKTAVKTVVGMSLEGEEEGRQKVYDWEAKHYAMISAGLEEDNDFFTDRLPEYFTSAETWNNVLGGAAGGGFIPAIGYGINKIGDKYTGMDKVYKAHKELLKERDQGIKIEYIKKISDAFNDNDIPLANSLISNFNKHTSVYNLNFDRIVNAEGDASLYNSQLNFLENTLKEATANPDKTDDIKAIENTYPELIKQTRNAKYIFDDEVADKTPSHMLIPMTHAKLELGIIQDSVEKYRKELFNIDKINKSNSGVSALGKEYHTAKSELLATLSLIKTVKQSIDRETNGEIKSFLKKELKGFEERLKKNELKFKEIEDDYNTDINDEDRREDNLIIGAYGPMLSYNETIKKQQQAEEDAKIKREEITKLHTKEEQDRLAEVEIKNFNKQVELYTKSIPETPEIRVQNKVVNVSDKIIKIEKEISHLEEFLKNPDQLNKDIIVLELEQLKDVKIALEKEFKITKEEQVEIKEDVARREELSNPVNNIIKKVIKEKKEVPINTNTDINDVIDNIFRNAASNEDTSIKIHPSPLTVGNLSNEDIEFYKEEVETLVKSMAKHENRDINTITFRDVINKLVNDLGNNFNNKNRINTVFNYIALGWNEFKGKNNKAEIDKVYHDIFQAQNFIDNLEKRLSINYRSEEERSKDNDNIYNANISVANLKTTTTASGTTSEPTIYGNNNSLISKVPMRGLGSTSISVRKRNEETKEIEIKTVWIEGSHVNFGIVDKNGVSEKGFAHPDKFNVGTPLVVKLATNEQLENIPVRFLTWQSEDSDVESDSTFDSQLINTDPLLVGHNVKIIGKIPSYADLLSSKGADIRIDNGDGTTRDINYKIEKDSLRYKDTVPMIMQHRDHDLSYGSTYAYDVNYFNPVHNNENQQHIEGLKNIARTYRNIVLEKGSLNLVITERSNGTFNPAKIKTKEEFIPLKNIPQIEDNRPKIGIYHKSFDGRRTYRVYNNVTNKLEEIDYIPEEISNEDATFVYFMPVNKINDKIIYQVSGVQTSTIKKHSTAIKDSIINMLYLYVKANVNRNDKAFIKEISDISTNEYGKDDGNFTEMKGAKNYIKNFYQTYVKINKEEYVEKFDIKVKNKGVTISSVDENGENQDTTITSNFFEQTPDQLNASKDIIYRFLDTLPINISLLPFNLTTKEGITGLNKQIKLVSKDGVLSNSDEYENYLDYIEQNLVHNIKSFNVANDNEEPYYTPNIIPILEVDITSNQVVHKPKDVIQEALKTPANNKDTKKEEIVLTNDDDKNIIINAFNAINGLYSTDYRQAKVLNQILNDTEPKVHPSPLTTLESIREYNRSIANISDVEKTELVNSISSLFHTKILNNDLNIKENKKSLKEEIQKYIKEHLDNKANIVELHDLTLKRVDKKKYPNVSLLINDYELLSSKINNLFSDIDSLDTSILINDIFDNLVLEKAIKEVGEEDSDKEDSGQLSFDKDSAEKDSFMKVGEKLKRFLFGQLDTDSEGNTTTIFLGLPKYVDRNEIWNKLLELTCSENCSDITFEGKINALKENATNLPWLWLEDGKQFTNELETNDYKKKQDNTVVGKLLKNNNFKELTQLQHNFTVAFTNNRRISKMVIVNEYEGKHYLKVYDTDLSSLTNEIKKGWISKIKNNLTERLGTSTDANYDVDKVRTLVKEYNELLNSSNDLKEDGSLFINWLNKVGIDISPELFTSFVEDKFYNSNGIKVPFSKILSNKKDKHGNLQVKLDRASIFGQLITLFDKILKGEEITFNESTFNGYDFQNIAKKQSIYSHKRPVTSTREGGKTLFGYTAGNLLRDRTNNLKKSEVRELFKQDTFSKNSMILELLETSDNFKYSFSIFDISKEAIKFGTKKSYQDTDTVSLSDGDHELLGLGMHQDLSQGKLFEKYKGFGLRMSSILPPSFSDKTSTYGIKTVALDLTKQNFDIDSNNEVTMKDDLRDILRDQLITPELNRIIQFNKEPDYNIAGYDGSVFYQFPQMNYLTISVNGEDVRLIKYLRNKGIITPEIQEQIKTKTDLVLNKVFTSLVNDKIKIWNELGITTDSEYKFDTKYVETKFENIEKEYDQVVLSKLVAYDYIINTMLTNAEIGKLYYLDNAFYVKGKIPQGKVLADLTDKETDHVINETVDITYDNITKRLASLIAPGNQISNSVEKDEYTQINLADIISASTQLTELIVRLGEFGAQGYGNNNSTDAQEYTTTGEHLNILVRYGKIPDSEVDFTEKDKEDAIELFKSNRSLTEKDKLLLRKVLQPMKPVYSGMYFDKKYGILRPIYIKSSSIPLIPQVTVGLEIDDLRRLMEAVEKKEKRFVRASYQSANKIGAVKNPLSWVKKDGTAGYVNEGDVSFFDDKGEINDEIVDKVIANHSHILNRSNLRIQQDVPFKSELHDEDTISNMTQMAVLKLANGVTGLEGFKYQGKTYSGKKIQAINNELVRTLLNHKQKIFDETYDNIEKIEKLLKKEAKDKGIQDVEALTLKEVIDENGNSTYEFNIPIWLTPDPDKYESLLQSIINKHIIKFKMPGYSYVAGSSVGYKDKGIRKFKDFEHTSRIVWADKPIDHLTTNQVLISSKFRDNNDELIDLTSDDYSIEEKREDGSTYRKLNKDKISDELLKLISIRIPTSNHSSMSLDDIVGFLPLECGDLMLVAPDKTTQKGLDFDVDKENTYHYWTYQDQYGKIVPLHRKYEIKTIDEQLKIAEGKTKDELNDIKEKVINNLMVELDRSILSHDTVKTMTHVILSIDDAKEQSKAIKQTNAKASRWSKTFLSDEYQKQAMLKNASGKLGTAVYSNALIMQALMEQIAITDPEHQLELTMGDELFEVEIDGKIFDGKLGKIREEGQSRNVLEVLGERQNFAVDNGTANIMGDVNINKYTFDADVIMANMNMDKGETVNLGKNKINSISFLLLNQPIIKDYVKMMMKLSSNLSEYVEDKDQSVVNDLLDKYYVYNEKFYEDGRRRPVSHKGINLTNAQFARNIESTDVDNNYQQMCLDLFLKLKTFGEVQRKIQSPTKINAKGLGKSLLDTVDMLERIDVIKEDKFNIFKIRNASILLTNNNLPQHYIETGLEESKNKWLKLFPYQTDTLVDILKEIGGDKELTVKDKQDMIIETKKFIFSRNTLLFTNNSTNTTEQNRRDLFIDSKNNESLPTYLERATHELVIKNDLIRSFNYELKVDGTPSLIIFNNKQAEGVSEKGMYKALLSLLTTNISLVNGKEEVTSDPVLLEPRNGKPYTTHNLLFDLLAYNYLKGGIQQATEFGKFIPVLLLDLKFTEVVRNIDTYLHKSREEVAIINKNYKKNIFGLSEKRQSKIFIQYKQHHPETLPKKKYINADNVLVTNGKPVIYIPNKENYPTMFSVKLKSIKDDKGKKQPDKFFIYLKTDLNGVYHRIPVLGNRNIAEYNSSNEDFIYSSIVNNDNDNNNFDPAINDLFNNDLVENIKSDALNIEPIPFSSNNHDTIMSSIIKDVNIEDENKEVVAFLKQYALPLLKDIKVESKGEVVIDGVRVGGKFDTENNTISLNKPVVDKDVEEGSRIYLHEVVHGLLSEDISKYFDENSKLKEGIKIPDYMRELSVLYNKAKVELKDRNKIKSHKFVYDNHYTNAASDIHEFISEISSHKGIQQYLAKAPYTSTMNLYDKFIDIVKKFFNSLAGNNITSHTIKNIMVAIDVKRESMGLESMVKGELKPTQPVASVKPITPISNDLKTLEQIDRVITYTPKGKIQQTYTVKGEQIFNKKGIEVFKTNSIDRNKILFNMAIKEKRATIITYANQQYGVYDNNDIISIKTGNMMNWSNNNGNRIAILKLAKPEIHLSPIEQKELDEINKICNPNS